jgi:aryl-alcohol dehydrogenase-like predicted oxidoreductase
VAPSSKSRTAKLGLGSVQFGTDYGVSNQEGQTKTFEVEKILTLAADSGIRVIDTAPAYGESEKVLGELLSPQHNFLIITKTASQQGQSIKARQTRAITDSFKRSLELLRQTSVYGLIIHHTEDLFAPGGDRVVEAMRAMQSQDLVKKIGVSVYDGDQIDRVLRLFIPELIQLPLNLLDQRLINDGYLKRLKDLNVEIHVRSVFMQGLLLMNPGKINPYFDPIKADLRKYFYLLREINMTPVKGALDFVLRQPEIDTVLVGVREKDELGEIIEAVNSEDPERIDYSEFALNDINFLNPTMWQLAPVDHLEKAT